MSKVIYILYAKNIQEVFNRKSALGSYIYCLSGLLEELGGYSVYINGTAYSQIKQLEVRSTVPEKKVIALKKMIPPFVKRILKDLQLFSQLKQLTHALENGIKPDLIMEFYSYASTIGLNLSVRKKVPLIVIYDSPVIDEYEFFNKAAPFFKSKINRFENNTLLQASSTVAYSESVKKFIHHKIKKNTEVAIHQNIDFSRFDFIEDKPTEDTINIGFIGSFLKWHRVDLLLKAFSKLKEEGYTVKLYLLGFGEEFGVIEKQVAANKFKTDIILTGFVDGEELLKYKKKIHIGVMPGSNWYGAPNKIFEYGASKMAVIAPNTPTIADLFLDKKELILFKNNSFDELFLSLKQLCDNNVLINELADHLQQKIRMSYSRLHTFNFYNSLIIKNSK
jgi:glycosyltransferase involved in cell wall biosynthesis